MVAPSQRLCSHTARRKLSVSDLGWWGRKLGCSRLFLINPFLGHAFMTSYALARANHVWCGTSYPLVVFCCRGRNLIVVVIWTLNFIGRSRAPPLWRIGAKGWGFRRAAAPENVTILRMLWWVGDTVRTTLSRRFDCRRGRAVEGALEDSLLFLPSKGQHCNGQDRIYSRILTRRLLLMFNGGGGGGGGRGWMNFESIVTTVHFRFSIGTDVFFKLIYWVAKSPNKQEWL